VLHSVQDVDASLTADLPAAKNIFGEEKKEQRIKLQLQCKE
jgi:hypothetical protein